jgi:uncharacterized repeat protein (TIGR01451 family)
MLLASSRPAKARRLNVRVSLLAGFFLALAVSLAYVFSAPHGVAAKRPVQSKAGVGGDAHLSDLYRGLPLRFEPNLGQTGGAVKFLARGSGYSLFLTEGGAVMRLRRAGSTKGVESDASSARNAAGTVSTLRFRLEGSNGSPKVTGSDELPGRSNYLIGGDARRWRTGVPAFARVRYESVYPGVDVIYYGKEGRLEYDFTVAPGADPNRIRLKFDGARDIRVDEGGDLLLATDAGDLRQQKPVAYQEVGGERREVQAHYVKGSRGRVGIELGSYDHKLPLVIDPILLYSSYIGDGNQEALAVAAGPDGSAYIVGDTSSTTFPGPSPIQAKIGALTDAFVLKLSPDGKSLVYATYLGGDGSDTATGIALDTAGNAYVSGWTTSSNFPTTAGAAQPAPADNYTTDAFVTKLNPSGSALVYSTYLGGTHSDKAAGIAVDADGAAYVVGTTNSPAIASTPVGVRGGHVVLKSGDGAGHWSAADAGLPSDAVNAFAAQPTDPNVIYAATDIGLFKSTNGGTSWQATGIPSGWIRPGVAISVAVDPSDPNTVYAGMGGSFYKSTDGGNSFTQKNSGMSGMPNTLLVAPTTPSTLYAGLGNGVYKSTDGGESWTKMSSGITGSVLLITKLTFDPSNPSTVYAGAGNGVFKTTNGGGLWSAVNTGLPANGLRVRTLAEDPTNPSTLYVTFVNFADVYKSTDGGAHWAVAGPPVTFTAGSETFNPFVNSLVVDPASPSTLYAGTFLGGVFKSTDGGASWAASNDGLTNKIVNAVLLTGGVAPAVYAGTSAGNDVFVAKLNPAGSQLAYLKTLAGSESDSAAGIAVGQDGSAYIAGTTSSPDFPVVNAFQQTLVGTTDAYVAKLDPAGSALTYSTFLGGSSADEGLGIAVDASGSAYVTGDTFSSDFPLSHAAQSTRGDSSTNDAFVTKFAPDGGSLVYSTYVGGSSSDSAAGIAVAPDGSAYITGGTLSTDFPITNPVQPARGDTFNYDAFVTKLTPSGSAFTYSTYLGGSEDDQGVAIAVDAAGRAYVVGSTFSPDFPVVNPLAGNTVHIGSFAAKIGSGADLAVSMTDSPDPVAFGSDLTYTINVKNNGDLQATGVTLADTLPAGASIVSATTGHGSCSGAGPVSCNLGTLASGESATITVTIKPPAVRTITNTASVTLNETDAATGNNSASATTTVDFADLSVSNSALVATVAPGSKVVYLLSAKNNGGTTTSQVTLADSLPSELTFVSCDSPHGTCGGTGNSRSVTFPSLAVGASESAVIVATLNASVAAGTTVANTATVSAALPDPDLSNNTASASISVGQPAVAAKSNGKIAFTSPALRIGVVGADGSGLTLLTTGANSEHKPSWSPDGTKIAFKTTQPGSVPASENVVVMNADGSGQVKVATNAAPNLRPVWSPAGDSIAFVGNDSSVYLVRPDGTGLARLISNTTTISGLDWSPDGAHFVISFGGSLFVTDLDGANRRQLTTPQQTSDGPTSDSDPRWSPDGSKILFKRSTINNHFLDTLVIGTDGTGLSRLLNIQGMIGADWSPDMTKVVFQSNGVTVANLDGSGLPTKIADGSDPDWQPLANPNPTPQPSPVPAFSISGRVTNADGSPALATVKLTGTQVATISTDDAGNYSFIKLPKGGIYTVTPVRNFNIYTPGGRTVGDLEADVTGFDFVSAPAPRPFIRGRVTDPDGHGLAGVSLQVFRNFVPQPTITTGSDGSYSIQVFLPGDLYIVQPLSSQFVFDRGSVTLSSVTNDTTVNFVGLPLAGTHSIGVGVHDSAGTPIAGVTVTLSGARSAVAKTDANGSASFINLPAGQTYTVTPSTATGFTFTTPQQTFNNLAFDQSFGFNATTQQPTVQFDPAAAAVSESAHSVDLTVTRTGDLSAAGSVDYETADVTASDRVNYTAAYGTVRFDKGESSKTVTILLTDNAWVEGDRVFNVTLKSGSGVGVRIGAAPVATVFVNDNDTAAGAPNPVDDSRFFVRQHYHDFLNREPDQSGLDFWTNDIEQCGTDAACRAVHRVNVSAAFFLSIEFQNTGYLVYRLHQAAFGVGEGLQLKTFLRDTQEIGQGVVVGQGPWQQQLEDNKNAFAEEFAARPEFLAAFPASLSPAQFVDGLNANTGGSLTQSERDALVAGLTSGTQTRGQVLRAVAENQEFSQSQFNKAFVYMQYVGYLRRNPNDPPDSDFSGYNFWLGKLNQFGGNYVQAEMVKAFISSTEYRQRFGQP